MYVIIIIIIIIIIIVIIIIIIIIIILKEPNSPRRSSVGPSYVVFESYFFITSLGKECKIDAKAYS